LKVGGRQAALKKKESFLEKDLASAEVDLAEAEQLSPPVHQIRE